MHTVHCDFICCGKSLLHLHMEWFSPKGMWNVLRNTALTDLEASYSTCTRATSDLCKRSPRHNCTSHMSHIVCDIRHFIPHWSEWGKLECTLSGVKRTKKRESEVRGVVVCTCSDLAVNCYTRCEMHFVLSHRFQDRNNALSYRARSDREHKKCH